MSSSFVFSSETLEIVGCGELNEGDAVLIRLEVDQVEYYSDGDYFRATLRPVKPSAPKSLWQTLTFFLTRRK